MKEKLEFSFDDEVVGKFCYDISNKKIEVYFTGYSDLITNQVFDIACVLIIENWFDAKSKVYNEMKYDKLEKHFSIISMILSLEKKGDDLELYVNTLDNKYLSLLFIRPQISFNKIDSASHS